MLPSVSAQVIGGEGAEISVKGVVSVQVKAILSYVLLGPGKVLAPLLCKKTLRCSRLETGNIKKNRPCCVIMGLCQLICWIQINIIRIAFKYRFVIKLSEIDFLIQYTPVYVRLGIGSQTDRRKGPDFHRKPPSTTDSIRSSGNKRNVIRLTSFLHLLT